MLDPEQSANVTITFQTDQSGTFQYIGIDLSKFGLTSLAALISAQSKTPTLQAKLTEKTTVSSQLDLAIPQTVKTIKVKPKYVVDPDTGKIKLTPTATIKGLKLVTCDPSRGLLTSLSLSSWLNRFFYRLARDRDENTETACMSKVTLKTSFVLAFDISAGVNPLISTVFILPVTGESVDFNPSATQSLQIVLSLKKYKDQDLCTKIPATQPNRTII